MVVWEWIIKIPHLIPPLIKGRCGGVEVKKPGSVRQLADRESGFWLLSLFILGSSQLSAQPRMVLRSMSPHHMTSVSQMVFERA